MSLKALSVLSLILVPLILASAGCEPGAELVNPDQPKDLGAPWVNRTDTEFSSSSVTSDAEQNRVFSSNKSEFGGLIQDIAAEYKAPIVVKPKKMLDWNLTVTVKGKNLDEVLNDVAAKCKLTLGKTSGGQPMLSYPADASGEEHTVTPEGDYGGSSDAESSDE